MLRIEATLHRIGGPEGPRNYLPRGYYLDEAGPNMVEIFSKENQAYYMILKFSKWLLAGEGWASCTVTLEHPDGHYVGTRPALMYAKPYDVATYTSFRNDWDGLFSLGLRSLATD